MTITDKKIWILGLPRTGTTSLSAYMLELGFKVAHTAYTQKTFDQAQVIADTPVFYDYQQIDKFYPNSKFIYLNRKMDTWLPSIKQLLQRMHHNVTREDGGFNPIIKRCYKECFSPFTLDNIENHEFLSRCYLQHQKGIYSYFTDRPQDLITIDLSTPADAKKLVNFISSESNKLIKEEKLDFPHMNRGGKVTAWKDLKHKNKVDSTKNGRWSPLTYLARESVNT